MKKRKRGGQPENQNATKDHKKIKFMGIWMYKEEEEAIKAGAQADGVTPSLFVVKHAVVAAFNPEP